MKTQSPTSSAVSRRRTRAQAPLDTRAQLLAAASALMSEGDTLVVSLSEIAQRAGVNAALVKYYFGNKDGLLFALLERDALRTIGELEELVDSSLPPTTKMRLHIAGMIRTLHATPYVNRLLLELMRGSDTAYGAQAAELVRQVVECYRRLIRQGVRTGEFKPIDPMLFYFTVTGACEQIFSARPVLVKVFKHPPVDRKLAQALTDHTISMVLAGLLARSNPPVQAE